MTYATHRHKNWRAGRNTQDKDIKRGFGLVEKMFYYYYRIKKAVAEFREELGYYQCADRTGGGSSSHAFISDPTAQIAIKHSKKINKIVFEADKFNVETVSRPEDWIFVVEQTLRYFDDGVGENALVKEVLSRRFLRNEAMATTCIDLEIGDNKYYKLRDKGVNYAREVAIQIGLIKICDLPKTYHTDDE